MDPSGRSSGDEHRVIYPSSECQRSTHVSMCKHAMMVLALHHVHVHTVLVGLLLAFFIVIVMLDREINVCEARKCPLNSIRSFQFNASHSPFKRFHHGLREDGERANHLLMRCALKMVNDREESLA